DTIEPIKPDAVFPNYWITTHVNGTIILYPMMAPSRRNERRTDIAELLRRQFNYTRLVDFSEHEAEERYLEGTGSMILDRVNRVVYACVGPRTDQSLLDEFCEWADYTKRSFRSVDRHGQDIYHTNVMMAIGTSFVVICLDSVPDPDERQALLDTFEATQKTIVEISFEQMEHFAGNMLQVSNEAGEGVLVMSEQAYQSLSTDQIQTLEGHSKLLYSPIETIEKYGGGSARCMMAEVFKPR
ncbi:MAG: arginine deiminase-related protein, partial [Bacteroidota bacterium]